jgi:D-serine deaminase-like pyridoxal phosphate-dependent protein
MSNHPTGRQPDLTADRAVALITALTTAPTPALVVDRERMDRNLARLATRLAGLGVTARPHLKTVKSVPAARRVVPDLAGPVTVSTLKEAEVFAAAGARDILYAVGIAPDKLGRVLALREAGVDLSIILDNAAQAEAVLATIKPLPVLLEIDADGHRSGLRPADPQLVTLGRQLVDGGAELRGVLTHAGGSYEARGERELELAAAGERDAAVAAAAALRAAGLPCPVVSVGSTPTAHFARDLTGVTEVRAGVYVFFDLVMAGLGVCTVADIALSVLATVIGHQRDKGWILTDAGWMAMSRDRGTAAQPVDQGYGLVCDLAGQPLAGGDLIMSGASQEHGILSLRPGSGAQLPDLPVGTRVRILPNHACATAAQHEEYLVTAGDSAAVLETWPIFRGW